MLVPKCISTQFPPSLLTSLPLPPYSSPPTTFPSPPPLPSPLHTHPHMELVLSCVLLIQSSCRCCAERLNRIELCSSWPAVTDIPLNQKAILHECALCVHAFMCMCVHVRACMYMSIQSVSTFMHAYCKKRGQGFLACWLAGWLAGWLADKCSVSCTMCLSVRGFAHEAVFPLLAIIGTTVRDHVAGGTCFPRSQGFPGWPDDNSGGHVSVCLFVCDGCIWRKKNQNEES